MDVFIDCSCCFLNGIRFLDVFINVSESQFDNVNVWYKNKSNRGDWLAAEEPLSSRHWPRDHDCQDWPYPREA